MASQLTRGSEWRRWDLHLHTPGTNKNDQYKVDLDGFVKLVAAANDSIAVLGITDYLSLENYRKVREHWLGGELPNIALVLPNIEFRVSPPTKKVAAINLHILVDPSEDDHCDKIGEALGRLQFELGDDKFSCTRKGLTALGRALSDVSGKLQDEEAYQIGVEKFVVDYTWFRKWHKEESWLSKNSLIAVAAGEDGLSGIKDDSLGGVRHGLKHFADFIFSGSPTEREYWLGQRADSPEALERRYRGTKPCLHGCDAHMESDLFAPAAQRYCWIRADCTFDGLRQVLYEPEDRVHIGPRPPINVSDDQLIADCAVSGAPWLKAPAVPLNHGLVAIIGPRGSGKTALADIIAVGGYATVDPRESFIAKAAEHLEGASSTLTWKSGHAQTTPFLATSTERPDVRYLSQQFVERLCSGRTDELVQEIEDVVYSHVPEEERYDTSSFSELRELLSTTVRERRARFEAQIEQTSEIIESERRAQDALPERKRTLSKLTAELDGLRKQQETITKGLDAKAAAAVVAADARVKGFTEETTTRNTTLRRLQAIRDSMQGHATAMREFFEAIDERLTDIGITKPEDHTLFEPVFRGDWQTLLLVREKTLRAEVEKLKGPAVIEQSLTTDSLARARFDLTQAQNGLALNQKQQQQLTATVTAIRTKELESKAIEELIRKTESKTNRQSAKAKDQRLEAYTGVFELLRDEKELLEQLYAPLRRTLNAAGSRESELAIVVERRIDVDTWAGQGEELFDLRKAGPFKGQGFIKTWAQTNLVPAWSTGDGAAVRPTITTVLETVRTAIPQLREGVSREAVAKWVYSTTHISHEYEIRYRGNPVAKLSPGTRGIVLLMLYLAIDTEDRRPLIIDQPEENLDSQSVFRELVPYFREARRRRQIIVVTHNPNLVVSTDADQVIVASTISSGSGSLPSISYMSGALENPEIRVGSSRVDLQACKLEYSIVSPK